MKKLILGLLLTVGISGVSFAGEIKDNYQKEIYPQKNSVVNSINYDEKNIGFEFLSCTISNQYITRDACGETIAIDRVTYESNNCGSNEGGIIMNVSYSTAWFVPCLWALPDSGYTPGYW